MSGPDYENRRLRFAELMRSRCGNSQAALAEAIGKVPNYVSRLLSSPDKDGHKRLGDGLVAAATRAFDLPHGWFDRPVGSDLAEAKPDVGASRSPHERGEAHLLTLVKCTVPSRRYRLEELDLDALPDLFELHLEDDSMSPALPIGTIGRFVPVSKRQPSAGRPALVTDKDGGVYVREFRPRTSKQFTAAALNASYEPLDSERDGLRVVAVMIGHDWADPAG